MEWQGAVTEKHYLWSDQRLIPKEQGQSLRSIPWKMQQQPSIKILIWVERANGSTKVPALLRLIATFPRRVRVESVEKHPRAPCPNFQPLCKTAPVIPLRWVSIGAKADAVPWPSRHVRRSFAPFELGHDSETGTYTTYQMNIISNRYGPLPHKFFKMKVTTRYQHEPCHYFLMSLLARYWLVTRFYVWPKEAIINPPALDYQTR